MTDTKAPDFPPLPLAYEYIYGWSGGHRSLSSNRWNGMKPDTSETVYTRDQMHAYLLADRASRSVAEDREPIDMVLHCPACGLQHVDAEDPEPAPSYLVPLADFDRLNDLHPFKTPLEQLPEWRKQGSYYWREHDGQMGIFFIVPGQWHNPPHRSHLCHGCEHVWRPADVATNGVAAIKTKGTNDSAAPKVEAPAVAPSDLTDAQIGKIIDGSDCQHDERADLISFARSVLAAALAVAPADALRVKLKTLGYSDTAINAMGDSMTMMQRAIDACAKLGVAPAVAEDQSDGREVIRLWNERARGYGFDGVAGMLNAMRHKVATTPQASATPPQPASPDVAKLKEDFTAYARDQSTSTHARTRYWLAQWAQLASRAIAAATHAKATQPAQATGEALAELLELKSMKERIAFLAGQSENVAGDEYRRLSADYERRKPLAWAAARAAHPTPAPAAVQEPEAGKSAPAVSDENELPDLGINGSRCGTHGTSGS